MNLRRRLLPALAGALLLGSALSARAGMVDTPAPREGVEEALDRALKDTAKERLEELAASGWMETYQLIILIATLVTVGILLVAIIGYGLFDDKKKGRLEDLP